MNSKRSDEAQCSHLERCQWIARAHVWRDSKLCVMLDSCGVTFEMSTETAKDIGETLLAAAAKKESFGCASATEVTDKTFGKSKPVRHLSQEAQKAIASVARLLCMHRNQIKLQDIIDTAKHAGIEE